jgi:flagellar motor switch protein FliM
MSANVEPAEAEAIRAMVATVVASTSAGQVERRDFTEPRRLSGEALKELAKKITAILPAASNELAVVLRKMHKLTLGSAAEVNASRLFHALPDPFLVWCYECNGQLAWLVWDSAAANRLVETILCGMGSETTTGRHFSPSECRVLEQIFLVLVGAIARPFGLEPRSLRLAQNAEELNGFEEIAGSSDKQRLMVHLGFDGPGGPSDVRIYLPGVFAAAQTARPDKLAPVLPSHASAIPVELGAYLGSVDVPLSELLGLEVGDVLPLGVESDALLELFVEDRSCARASWGTHKGKLAVKILAVDPRALEIDQPEE